MLCCAMGVAAVATGAIGWRRFRRYFIVRLTAHTVLTAVVVAMVTMTAAGVVADHLRHHAAYADEALAIPADLGVLPLCQGNARATEMGSIRE